MENQTEKPVLRVENLDVKIKTDEGTLHAVRGIDFNLFRGKTLGLVGESGCGKSLTSRAILGINAKNCAASGHVWYRRGEEETDLMSLSPKGKEIRSIRGGEIAMIFQEPMTAFSPLYTIGNQIVEMIRLHRPMNRREARGLAAGLLQKVGIANADRRIDQYPHEFSGGMLQRALIAMALSCNPSVLIADEPTTALDVTIQAQILELMQSLQKEYQTAILFITHDLGVVARMCDEIVVMYLGEIVECGTAEDVFLAPSHPYTQGLLRSVPKFGGDAKEPLVSIPGTVPLALNLRAGCGFYDRCSVRTPRCRDGDVPNVCLGGRHYARCVLAADQEGESNE